MTAWVSGGAVQGAKHSGLCQGATSLYLKRPLSISLVDAFEPTALKSNSPPEFVAANKNMTSV